MKVIFSIILAFCFSVLPGVAIGSEADKATAADFFNEYVELSNNYDTRVADLYSDDAVIRSYRIYPNDITRALEMTIVQWRRLITEGMRVAKEQEAKKIFKNIEITINGSTARIKADRYSNRKCYTDTGFFMVLERQPNDKYLIIEEYSEIYPHSFC